MDRHSDDIRKYIRLTESSIVSSATEDTISEDLDLGSSLFDIIVEDVGDTIFKLRSYSESEGSPEYARGVEEGLALAASILERILERHTGQIIK